MKITLGGFRGEIPIMDATLLPDMAAQAARNVYLKKGTLKPERAPALASEVPSVVAASALYRYPNGNNGEGFWFVWGGGKRVDVVKSPLANDTFKRVYWTGDGAPKMGGLSELTAGNPPYPSNSYRLGVPPAEQAPTAKAAPGRAEDEPLVAVRTTYVVTQISRFGEQGAPSLPSQPVMRWDMVDDAPAGGDVIVTLPPVSSGAHDIVSKGVYRSEQSGVFQLVAVVPASTATYRDSIPSEELGAALPSLEWDMPDARMTGLTELPGGFMAGFFENTLCFSEAFHPHAWPVSYQQAFSDDVVGVVSVTGGLVVATSGKPIIVSGSSPAAMSAGELDADQPCLSGRSLVDMGEYALYASPNGLVACGGSEASVVTQQIISSEQWKVLKPETIHAYRHEGRYLAFYDGGCFAFTPGEGLEFYDVSANSGYYDISRDTLYLIQGSKIGAWGKGDLLAMQWRSKVFEVQPGTSYSCGKVVAREYPVSLELRADGEVIFSDEIAGPGVFRLPAGYASSRTWEVELSGRSEIQSVQIAGTPSELI